MVRRDLSVYLKVMKLRENGLGNRRISKKLDLPLSTVSDWIYRDKKPHSISEKWEKTKRENSVRLKRILTKKLPESCYKISKELAYILGVVAGDGFVCKCVNRAYIVGLSVIDKDFAYTFKKNIKKWCGYSPSVYYYKNMIRVYFYSFEAYKFIKSFDVNFLLCAKSIEKSFFLKGFFDSEGHVGKRHVSIGNTNLGLVNLTRKLLIFLGIRYTKIYVKKLKDGEKTFYYFYVWGKENLRKFQRYVNFSIKRKIDKLTEIIQNLRDEYATEDYYKVMELRNKYGFGAKKLSILIEDRVPFSVISNWIYRGHLPSNVKGELKSFV